MLPLADTTSPLTAETFAEALRLGFASYHVTAQSIAAEGDSLNFSKLKVDLTGAKIDRTVRLPKPQGNTGEQIAIEDFHLLAAPGHFEGTPATLIINARAAKFTRVPAQSGDTLLSLNDAQHGDISIEAPVRALEALLQNLATQAAANHGVEVRGCTLTLNAVNPKTLHFRAEVTAKMFIATAKVGISGELSVDDEFTARFRNLQLSGEGMIANVASSYLRPQLEKLEGRSFPLLAFSLGSVKLRDLQVTTGDNLKIAAQFGAA